VNISPDLRGLDQVTSGLRQFGQAVAAPAAQAATNALATAIDETRRANGLTAPPEQQGEGARRSIGVSDPASIAREFGTLEQDANPWLAPSLPTARSPMRAAAQAAVARALSAFRFNNR
jgi:hypothetical protein